MTIDELDPMRVCGLCGHQMALINCGFASVTDANGETFLCHADDHDCYHWWTVYGTRPTMDVAQAQAYHDDHQREADDVFDRTGVEPDEPHHGDCWCCCWDCGFIYDAVMAGRGVPGVHW